MLTCFIKFIQFAVAPEAVLDEELKKTLELRAGMPMRFHIPLRGRPAPKVTWAKMNTNIKNRQGIVIRTTDIDTLVYIEKVNRYDAGKYVLNLESTTGMKMYTITVKVFGKLFFP